MLECPGGDRVADLGHQHPLGVGITLCLPGDLFVTTKPLTQPRKEHLISISISISISPGTGARTGTGTNRIKGGLRTHDPIMTTTCDNEASTGTRERDRAVTSVTGEEIGWETGSAVRVVCP